MAEVATLGEFAVYLARGAADVITRAVEGTSGRDGITLEVEAKSSSTDLVTQIDRAGEQWLVDQLGRHRPDDAVLGEEGGGRAGTSATRWLLDPIDGTVNFVLGLPEYAVSVAAEVAGQVAAGAVCVPVSGELFQATRGGGAWLGGRRLRGPRQVDLERAVVGTGFSYDRVRRGAQGRVAAELLPRVADIRRIGSAALDLCALAAGRLDAYYEMGLNPWDLAAGALIAQEAGCVVRGADPSGQRSGGLVAGAGPQLAVAFFALLDEVGAERV